MVGWWKEIRKEKSMGATVSWWMAMMATMVM